MSADERPEIMWRNGAPFIWCDEMPLGTRYIGNDGGEYRMCDPTPGAYKHVVVPLVAWPDGTAPTPPPSSPTGEGRRWTAVRFYVDGGVSREWMAENLDADEECSVWATPPWGGQQSSLVAICPDESTAEAVAAALAAAPSTAGDDS